MPDDPWSLLPAPAATNLSTRRVDAANPFDFFWAVNPQRRCMLILVHASASKPESTLPRIKGIGVSEISSDRADRWMLALELQDPENREIFLRLCNDIVATAGAAQSESQAVTLMLSRTWRWHHLLKGGNDDRLTEEEQKGLIGELLVLQRHLLPTLSAHRAVTGWTGPMGTPRDFELGKICIEVKARRGSAQPSIAISSAQQLDDTDLDALFLSIVDLASAVMDHPDAMTVTTLAAGLSHFIETLDPAAAELFDTRLLSTGFRWEDDYSDCAWLEGTSRMYRVATGFPRITLDSIPPGVDHLRYSIDLSACDPYSVPVEKLILSLKGGLDVH